MFEMQALYEEILTKKRGYTSKWPDNKNVVVVLSGGLDSVITTAWLLEEMDFNVFPIHIQRGQTNAKAEELAVNFFENYFLKKYKGKFFPVKHVNVNIPPKEIKDDLAKYMSRKGYPLRDPLIHQYAVQYACTIQDTIGAEVKTIICGIVPEDVFPHSTLAALRSTTIAVCENLNDWDWVISSPHIDSNISSGMNSKTDEIKWATDHKLPLEKTISCNIAKINNCGICSSCIKRKKAFEKAGVYDNTVYDAS